MITKLFVDSVFQFIESLLGFLNYDASFFAEFIDIASSHLDTIVNVLKTVLFIVPSGVLTLIPFVNHIANLYCIVLASCRFMESSSISLINLMRSYARVLSCGENSQTAERIK